MRKISRTFSAVFPLNNLFSSTEIILSISGIRCSRGLAISPQSQVILASGCFCLMRLTRGRHMATSPIAPIFTMRIFNFRKCLAVGQPLRPLPAEVLNRFQKTCLIVEKRRKYREAVLRFHSISGFHQAVWQAN